MREMKSSGLPWIGDIPRSWSVTKFKHIFSATSERNPGNVQVLSLYREHGIVPKDSRDDNHNVTSLDTSNYRYVQRGDFVVNKMKAWQGSTAVSDYEGIVSPAYYVFRFREENVSKRFYHYLLRSKAYAQQFAILSGGIRVGQWDLPFESLYNIGIIMPPIDEQSRIASFLDSHIAKIDDSIARYKALSDKLDEYRKAVITKAVTEGIRDTGFNKCDFGWVNVIPEKWDIALLSQLYSPVKCFNRGMIEKNLLSLSYGKIKRKSIENVEGLVPDNYEGYNIIEKNDIVLRLTDLQNDQKSLRVGISKEKGIVTSAYCSIRPDKNFNSTYYYYLLYAFDISKGFYGMGSGIRQGLNWTELKFLKMQIPSRQEQDEIVSYLDKKCAGIDCAKEKIEAVVKKLEEYKKSLIYNAVTGKIEC